MKHYVKVLILERRLYEIEGAKTGEQAVEMAKERTRQNSPLGLSDTRRDIHADSGIVESDHLE